MKILSHSNSEFCIAHFQGKSMPSYKILAEEFMSRKISINDNISVITCFNNYDLACLAQQLDKNNIKYVNKTNPFVAWNNPLKLEYICMALNEIKTPYVLICDANDVLFSNSIGYDIIEHLNDNGLKMLYNATTNNHPNITIDKIENRDWFGKFCFMNAGVCIADTEYAKEFYTKSLNLHKLNNIYNPLQSEQLIIRHIFADVLDESRLKNVVCPISFDYRSRFFQSFSNTHVVKTDNDTFKII